jgi:dolichol kinase
MERIRLEIKRQPIHILLGLLLVALIYYDFLTPLILLALVLLGLVGSSYIKKTKPKTVYKLLEFVERGDALESLPGKGLIAYLLGALITLFLFEKQIAMASIMILALGDSFSRLIGPFGRIRHPFNNTKFLEGMIAGIIAASLGAMLFVTPSEAITASFLAILVEGIEMKLGKLKIDDNIVIPVISGLIIWFMRAFF